MSAQALFLVCLAVAWLVGLVVGLRIGWLMWRRDPAETRTEVTIWERPQNVIAVTSGELRERAAGRSA